jgi:hypothetical protein
MDATECLESAQRRHAEALAKYERPGGHFGNRHLLLEAEARLDRAQIAFTKATRKSRAKKRQDIPAISE